MWLVLENRGSWLCERESPGRLYVKEFSYAHGAGGSTYIRACQRRQKIGRPLECVRTGRDH